MHISADELYELREAKILLERVSLAAKMTNLLGKPIEKGLAYLPEKWKGPIQDATKTSLLKGFDFLTKTFDYQKIGHSYERIHKAAAITSGAIGGAFGVASLAVELPVSTMIMLRAIMEIARREGEDIQSIESKLSCLEVFALGGRSTDDDFSEVGYYTVRMAMARSLSEAAKYIAERGIAEEGAPAIVKFLAQLSSRFGVVVSEKFAAQALPVVGAVAGAAINGLFIDHFQNVASGHFTVRRLERLYGAELVQYEYERLAV